MKGTPRMMGKGNLRTAMGLAAIYCERKTEGSKSNAPRVMLQGQEGNKEVIKGLWTYLEIYINKCLEKYMQIP